jgi:hypothetical protein
MTEAEEHIGVASMEADGTIILRLRANGEGGTTGDGTISYRPDSQHYQSVLEHLGGLEPGETKPVKPWP